MNWNPLMRRGLMADQERCGVAGARGESFDGRSCARHVRAGGEGIAGGVAGKGAEGRGAHRMAAAGASADRAVGHSGVFAECEARVAEVARGLLAEGEGPGRREGVGQKRARVQEGSEGDLRWSRTRRRTCSRRFRMAMGRRFCARRCWRRITMRITSGNWCWCGGCSGRGNRALPGPARIDGIAVLWFRTAA